MPDTFVKALARRPSWMLGAPARGQLAERFWGVVIGLTGALFAEGFSLASRFALLRDEESPDDVLQLIGHERRLPRYLGELPGAYRARLQAAWSRYRQPGLDAIETDLANAGFAGIITFSDQAGPRGEPPPYWSQFWVFFAQGTHTVTSGGKPIGSFDVGDGTIIGPQGMTPEQFRMFKSIVLKWKPSRWVARALVFQVSGWTIGDGTLIGEENIGGITIQASM